MDEAVPVRRGRRRNTKGFGILWIIVCTLMLFFHMITFGILGLLIDDAFSLHISDALMDIMGNLGIAFTAWVVCHLVKVETGRQLRGAIRIKDFHFSLVIMLTAAGWSLGEVCDHLMGSILCNYMQIQPDVSDMSGVWGVISAVICAPIFEELIFRYGYVGLLKDNSSKAFTLFFTTIIFAAAHTYNLQNTGNVFMGTILAAYVYYRTGNILYTILEHAIHNALCYVPIENWKIFGTEIYYERNGFILAGMPWFWIQFVIMILSISWIIVFFRKRKES